MELITLLENEFNKLNLITGNFPPLLDRMVESIPARTIPYRMKLTLAISELMTFISHFRINIHHWNNSSIPINSITFCIAKSGAAKDSSVRAVHKCFESGYEILKEKRAEYATKLAMDKCKASGCKNPGAYSNYKEFYIPPAPLSIAISTAEGLAQTLNDSFELGLGAGYAKSGEIGTDLISNPNMTEFLRSLSELYDTGDKEVKMIKTRDQQLKEIKGMPMSAMFLGSHDNILYDQSVKNKFKIEFGSKLARRTFFIYVNENIENEGYASIQDMIEREEEIENQAIEARNDINDFIRDLTYDLLDNVGGMIEVSKEVRDLFTFYKKYNECRADNITFQYPLTKLTRCHMQWKALKISGALALIENSAVIEESHYKAAVEFVELIYKDIQKFEAELTKQPYELFATYCKDFSTNGEFKVSIHTLRKLGFISGKMLDASIKELHKLVSSYDKENTYILNKDEIVFKIPDKDTKIPLSYLSCTGTKAVRTRKCANGFISEEISFKELENMLCNDYAYSPFHFKNGKRATENICSGCGFIVLDVDDSLITDEQAHILLSDYNHLIARTSKKDNPYKYRVLLELKNVINIDDMQWTKLIKLLSKELGLNADPLPKSQIFFSYVDRDVYSQYDAEKLDLSNYIDVLPIIHDTEYKPTESSANEMLDNRTSTFEAAFNAPDKEGRRKMVWAVKYAKELGADLNYCLDLLDDINNYWAKPMPDKDLETLKNSVRRMQW